jgi:hypothetical protein
MTVRLVADVQNRLFWRVGTGRASGCWVPSAGMEPGVPRWTAMCRLSGACRVLGLCVAADTGVDRGDSPEPTGGADVWFEPAYGQPAGLQTGGYNVLTCENSNRNSDLRTYRA